MARTGSAALALGALLLALVAGAGAALSGLGNRWEWWGYRDGLAGLRYAVYAGLLAAALAAVAAARARPGSGRAGLGLALAALGLACEFLAWPLLLARTARRVPPIHDITTDTERPPEFAAVVPLRSPADNPLAYGGAALAAEQHRAYPDLAPLRLAAPPAEAFARALAAVRRLGWTLVAADAAAGRIEAFDRTPWFGFFDDVVVRVAAGADGGSRIDVRSASRVGRSDVGANAQRIRRYLREVSGGGRP